MLGNDIDWSGSNTFPTRLAAIAKYSNIQQRKKNILLCMKIIIILEIHLHTYTSYIYRIVQLRKNAFHHTCQSYDTEIWSRIVRFFLDTGLLNTASRSGHKNQWNICRGPYQGSMQQSNSKHTGLANGIKITLAFHYYSNYYLSINI